MSARRRAIRDADPEGARAKRRRPDLGKYGLTSESLDAMVRAQSYACALCRLRFPLPWGKQVHIDHCHRTGKLRGILCANCNTGLGQIGDDAKGAYRAYLYTKTFEVFGHTRPLPRPGSSRILREIGDVWYAAVRVLQGA